MKKLSIVAFSVIFLGVIILSGCTNSVATKDFAKVQNDLTEAQNRVAALETQVTEDESRIATLETQVTEDEGRIASIEIRVVAFSAYHIWFDQFNNLGNYEFADSDTFITEFGDVVDFIADSDLSTAWDNYIATEKPLRDYAAGLPSEPATWTDSQREQYQKLVSDVYNALGAVGQALLSAIWNL